MQWYIQNPLQKFWSLLGDEEILKTGMLAVLMMKWLDLATQIQNINYEKVFPLPFFFFMSPIAPQEENSSN